MQEELARALSEDRRVHKAAIVEERRYRIESAPYSDRLHDQAFANQVCSPDRALWRARTMFTRRMPVFQFQTVVQLVASPGDTPRKSPRISCLLFPVGGYWEPSKRRLPPLAVDHWIARAQVRCIVKLVSICARERKREYQRRANMPCTSQQFLRRMKDNAHHDKVKVNPPKVSWNPTQGRRRRLDNERPNFSSPDLTDRHHENPTRDVRGLRADEEAQE